MTDERAAGVDHGIEVDLRSLRLLYRETLPYVHGYLLQRLGGDAALAQDLTQETYLAAVQEAKKRADLSVVAVPWLIGVARHKLVDHFRRLAREERKLSLVAQANATDSEADWANLSAEHVVSALAALPALQRVAVSLRYVDDLSVPEVARLLDRSIHATESLLARGRAGLRRHYLEADDD